MFVMVNFDNLVILHTESRMVRYTLFNLREIRSDSVLEGLKDTSQIAAHREILSRSVFRQFAAFVGSTTTIKTLVLSAESQKFEPISVTMSLMYNRKSKSPRIDP